MGLSRAGFDVVGVDIRPQPRYPFEFHEADALTFPLDGFDFIWASPPCQGYSDMKAMPTAKAYPRLIDPIRERLESAGVPWVIENVEGAPIEVGMPHLFRDTCGILLCGSMFGARNETHELRRHRLFESNIQLSQPRCQHGNLPVMGFYGDHAQDRRRRAGSKDRGTRLDGDRARKFARELMDIDWMKWKEVCEAIPPAYSEFIGLQVMNILNRGGDRPSDAARLLSGGAGAFITHPTGRPMKEG